MKFFPYENFYIVTRLKPDQVQLRLEIAIGPVNDRLLNFRDLFTRENFTQFRGYSVNGMFEFKPTSITAIRLTLKLKEPRRHALAVAGCT